MTHRENTKEKTDCEKYGHIAQEYDVAFTRCGVCDSELSLYSIADIKTIVEARVREERKRMIEEIKEMTLDIQPLPEDAKRYMGDFERGTVGGGYYVKETILEILTPKDTK